MNNIIFCLILTTPLPCRGGVPGGRGGVGNFICRAHNLSQDSLHRRKHLLITKAEYPNTLFIKIFCSLVIVFILIIMAGAIKFYAESMFRTIEIKDERTYSLLTTKFHASCATTFQGAPKQCFCWCHTVAQSLAVRFLLCSICLCRRIMHTFLYITETSAKYCIATDPIFLEVTDPTPPPTLHGRGVFSPN